MGRHPNRDQGPATFRVMTYNVHRCIGGDGLLAPARIARVIAQYEPDLVALQELDVAHARTGHADQPETIAKYLGMTCFFHPAIGRTGERYGDAILSRLPLQLARAGALPTVPDSPGLEPRGALWVTADRDGRTLQLLNTHLGLNRRERLLQAEALLGPEWLGHPACTGPRILCGDFNAWPGTAAYHRLGRALRVARPWSDLAWPHGTFPARWPVLPLDHVFLSSEWSVRRVVIPWTPLTRVASDHLPVLVEVSLP